MWLSLTLISPCARNTLHFHTTCGNGLGLESFFFFFFCCQQCGLAFSIIAATREHQWKDSSTATYLCPVKCIPASSLSLGYASVLLLDHVYNLLAPWMLAQREKKGQNFWKCSTDCWCKRIRHARVESGPWVFQKRIKGELSFNPVLVSTRRRMGGKGEELICASKRRQRFVSWEEVGGGSSFHWWARKEGTEQPIKNRYFVNIPW